MRCRMLVGIAVLLLVAGGLFAQNPADFPTPSWWTGHNRDLPNYWHKPGTPHYDDHARYIGELSGTWEQMGVQYGQRAGDLMRLAFDGYYEQQFSSVKDDAKLLAGARKYADILEKISPEVVQFMRGMAKGADAQLAKSYYQVGNSFDKVIFINHYFALRRITGKEWTPGTPMPAPKMPDATATSVCNAESEADDEMMACSGMVVIGKVGGPTKDRTTLHSGTKDQSWYPQMYQVTYAAVPSDPKGHKFWTLGTAGEVAGQMAGNDHGVVVSGYAGPNDAGYFAYGMEWDVGCWYAAALGGTCDEAADLLTIGRPSYRAATGRKTMTPAWGINWLISDPKTAAVVEACPGRYAVRHIGDLGEEDYIVNTNHAMATWSYDENNVRTDVPMVAFGPYKKAGYAGINASGGRYWTLWWQIKRNWGNIDVAMVQDWYRQHYFIDEQGYRHDYAWDEKKKAYMGANHDQLRYTLCRHQENPDRATNTDAKVSVAQDLAFYFTNGRPGEWEGDWDQISLKYSNFR